MVTAYNEHPTLICPVDATVDTDIGAPTALVDYSRTIKATDNSGDIPTVSPDPNLTFPANLSIGVNLFNFTATDSSENSDNCTFTIQVEDNEKPTLICPVDATVDTDIGAPTALVDYSRTIIANDNSGDVLPISPNPYVTFPSNLSIGANLFNFTAKDSSENSDNCTFTIKVEDNEQPTLICPVDAIVDTDIGAPTALVDYSTKIKATDNSGDVPTISPDTNIIFPANLSIGANLFNFTATDISENFDNCTFTIQVEDNEQPTLICPVDAIVDTDIGAPTAFVDYSTTVIATDSSGDVPIVSPDPHSTFPANLSIGANLFNFTATDSSENSDNCTFTIKVEDNEQPTLTCPVDATVDTDIGAPIALVDYSTKIHTTDNSGDVPTISPDPYITFPANLTMGANLFNFTAIDSSGNTDNCTFTINVKDNEQPTLTCPVDTTVDTDIGAATALVNYSTKIHATDNSGDVPTISPDPYITFPANPTMGANLYNFTAIDSSGNTDNCTFTINVEDNEQPILTCADATVNTDKGAPTAFVDYSSNIYATDNSGDVPKISPDPNVIFPANLSIGENRLNFTAADSSGNTKDCTLTIMVEETVVNLYSRR
ncbi:hyalin-like [Anneissia japonica]|uniref:hyalin-like n=1 Tax=Anneissia japonica TaxID=1529436 RepID=UPI001425AF79|nr:hyalin-like [Anneissia japonica]